MSEQLKSVFTCGNAPPSKIVFTAKQKELVRLFKSGGFKRLNIIEGSVRSGKTWISLVIWALWVASSPHDYTYMMCAKSLQTLKRNCLEPLLAMVGEKFFSFSLSKKEGSLFGRKIAFEGVNDARSENKIRGATLGGAYCDELSLFNKDFFVMLLSRLSVPGAKLIATTNPDVPTHWLLTDYLENKDLEDDILRVFFHVDDNTSLPTDYVNALKREYSGVFYDRFIAGKWVAAEGAVYKIFSDSPESFYVDANQIPPLHAVYVGLDFGGSASQHALCAVGFSTDPPAPFNSYDSTALQDGEGTDKPQQHAVSRLFVLKSKRIPAKGMTPQQLFDEVETFCVGVADSFGSITALYADSAEQTLIAGLKAQLKPLAVPVKNALKREINDRIRAALFLMSARRFFLLRGSCNSLDSALRSAVWNDRAASKESRLDDGSSDVDSLDAFEYAYERQIPRLVSP